MLTYAQEKALLEHNIKRAIAQGNALIKMVDRAIKKEEEKEKASKDVITVNSEEFAKEIEKKHNQE